MPPVVANLATRTIAPPAIVVAAATVAPPARLTGATVSLLSTALIGGIVSSLGPGRGAPACVAAAAARVAVKGAITTPRVRATCCIGRGSEIPDLFVLLLDVLAVQEHGIESSQRDDGTRGVDDRQRLLERLELRPKADDDVVDQLVIGDRGTDRSKRVGEAFHPVEVFGGGEVVLLHRGELATKVADAGAILRREHGVDARPHRCSGVTANHLADELLSHGADEDREDTLIRVPPEGEGRIGLRDGRVARAGGDRPGRRDTAPVEEAEPTLAGDVRHDLGFPEEKVRAIKPHGDGGGASGGHGGGKSRRRAGHGGSGEG